MKRKGNKGATKPERFNIDRVYNYTAFNRALEYGNEHSSVEMVGGLLDRLREERTRYNADIGAFVNAERAKETENFTAWQSTYVTKQVLKYVLIAWLILVWILGTRNIPGISYTVAVILFILGLVLLIPLIVAFVVTKSKEIICRKRYRNQIDQLQAKIRQRQNDFDSTSRAIYNKIDERYLLSLDPAYREMILLRRENEKRNKEHEKHEREMLRLQQEVAIEAARTRQAQERVLAIEEQREAERHRYYY